METFRLRSGDEFIKLGQLLKAMQVAESGGEAKDLILEGHVLVNGEKEVRRGRKLYSGDIVSCGKNEIKIEK